MTFILWLIVAIACLVCWCLIIAIGRSTFGDSTPENIRRGITMEDGYREDE